MWRNEWDYCDQPIESIRGSTEDMAKKNILFIITAIITISIFALGFNLASSSVLEAISFLNSYGGFFGFISIALLIFLFFIEKKYEGRKINAMKENQKRGYREKQKRIFLNQPPVV